MFLNKNNTLRWKWIGIAAALVVALCVAGILWLDAPLYFFLRRFDGAWTRAVDVIFSFKAWVVVFCVISAISFAKKFVERRAQSEDVNSYKLKDNIPTTNSQLPTSTLYALRSDNFFCVLLSVVVGGAIGGILKITIGRMRPIFLETFGQTGFYPFTNEWAFNSMPSGHTIATFAGLVMIGMLYPRFKPLTWTLAIVVGISRICGGAHFPSDVLLGAFIGMLCADFIAHSRKPIAHSR